MGTEDKRRKKIIEGCGGDSAKREGQVLVQSRKVAESIKKLSAVVGELENRLCRAMRPDPGKVEGNDKMQKEVQELVPLAGDMRAIQSDVIHQTSRIESILERLEI
ncbi:MAG: hypothetical protein ABIE47_12950 [Pseudomonadota bacterium]